MSSRGGESDRGSTVPRAVIHKKILDAAQSRPNASIEALTTTVNGASEDLVERVLDEYGDPAANDQTASETEDEASEDPSDMSNNKTNGSVSDASTESAQEIARESAELTKKQREALDVIREYPDATQKDLAERFDVTQSTINSRLNSIEGFDWQHRQEFVEAMLDNNNSPHDEATPSSASAQDLPAQVDDLADQVETLEQRLDDQSTSVRSPFGDVDLTCKVVRACMHSDAITEDEEVAILKEIITSTG